MTELTADLALLRSGLLHAAESLESAAAAITEGATPPVDPPPSDPEGPPPPVQHTPPVAFGDALSIETGQPGSLDVTLNDQLGDGAFASIEIVTPPAHGDFVLDGRAGDYRPSPGFVGSDEFRYTITDDNGLTSNIATVAITVTAVQPPPPPPPPQLAMKLTGFHPAHGTNGGAPVDVMASLQGCDQQLRPRNPSQVVGLWPLMDKWELLRPGRGMPANIFQRLTDAGQVALLTMPMLVRNPAANGGKGGEGDFDSVVRGSNDAQYDAILEWIERQGQGHCRIRLAHEQGSEGWFPHSIGHLPDAVLARRDFSAVKAANEYVMKYVKRRLPNVQIVYSHFWQPHTKASPTVKKFYHPDEFAPPPECYDIGSVDWYDGKGQPISAANIADIENQTRAIPEFGGKRAPQGVLAWEAYFKALRKPFAVCEWGIVCEGPSQPERDNPFFIERMHRLNLDRGWAHCCYFNPHDRNGPHRLKDGTLAGTRRATDKYIELHRGA